jgi:hypothetical protein
MNVIEPTHATPSKSGPSSNRQWRRRQIIATYASYTAAQILTAVRAHATLTSGARLALGIAFGLSAIAFIVSLVWLVGPSVRYGLGTRSYRHPAPGELKRLKDQGVSAKEAAAMFTRAADERQRAIRQHAEAVTYRILGPVIVFVAIYLIYARTFFDHVWLPSTPIEQVGLLAGFALLFSTLPSAVVAWSEPDPVPDDDAPGSR